VPRWRRIGYRGLGLDGQVIEREAEGLHARVVQHEVDHLDGVLYLDRLRDLTDLAVDAEAHHLADRA
jgi:peptide deformylase